MEENGYIWKKSSILKNNACIIKTNPIYNQNVSITIKKLLKTIPHIQNVEEKYT